MARPGIVRVHALLRCTKWLVLATSNSMMSWDGRCEMCGMRGDSSQVAGKMLICSAVCRGRHQSVLHPDCVQLYTLHIASWPHSPSAQFPPCPFLAMPPKASATQWCCRCRHTLLCNHIQFRSPWCCCERAGECLHTLVGHSTEIVCLTFNPQSTCVATGSMDNSAKVSRCGAGLGNPRQLGVRARMPRLAAKHELTRPQSRARLAWSCLSGCMWLLACGLC